MHCNSGNVFCGDTGACSHFRACYHLIHPDEVNSSGGRLTLVARQPGTRRSSCLFFFSESSVKLAEMVLKRKTSVYGYMIPCQCDIISTFEIIFQYEQNVFFSAIRCIHICHM